MPERPKIKKKGAVRLREDIVQQLYYNGAMSCPELSLKLGKSIPTVTTELMWLMGREIILEHGLAPSKGGRRAALYILNPKEQFILSVAMDQFITTIAILDLNNNFICDTQSIDLPLLDNEHILDQLTDSINAYLENSGISRTSIIGAGIGLPGFFDLEKDINYTYRSLSIAGLSTHIADKIGIPTYMDNDSSLIALAELRFGLARGRDDAMVVNIGWGIGLGMILKNEIFRGHNGLAGELSHIPLLEDGKLCACGKQGCLEAEASLMSVSAKVAGLLTSGQVSSLSVHQEQSLSAIGLALLEEANKGDQLAVQLVSDSAYQIGKALAILVHIMNPEAIILSGRGSAVKRIIVAPIQQALNKFCIPRMSMDMDLLVSELGVHAQLYGGAALVMDNYEINVGQLVSTGN